MITLVKFFQHKVPLKVNFKETYKKDKNNYLKMMKVSKESTSYRSVKDFVN